MVSMVVGFAAQSFIAGKGPLDGLVSRITTEPSHTTVVPPETTTPVCRAFTSLWIFGQKIRS